MKENIDFCEGCGDKTPLDKLSADGYRCIKCDPSGIEREGTVEEDAIADDWDRELLGDDYLLLEGHDIGNK